MDKVIIFDTTLRDGEQSPGAGFNMEEKLEIAHALSLLGVDVMEAGFPAASDGDFEAVKAISAVAKGPIVAGLARALKADIQRAADALKGAEKPRIHVFLGTSPLHRQHQLNKSADQVLALAVEAVKFAKGFVQDVEFSAMDASRTEDDYLCTVVQAVIEAGATTVNIPDTVGYAIPEEFGALIRMLKTKVPNIDQTIISVHCHNDLGLSTANSLAALRAGARQIECTINGLGERAGNASLEEVVMAVKTRAVFFGIETRVNTKRLIATSRLVSDISGFMVQKNKAIVGENAFAHASGIHQDGVLKERTTFEIMRPVDVGLAKSQLVLGKLSGRHALRQKLHELGIELDDARFNETFKRFKDLADKKKEILDEDIIALSTDTIAKVRAVYGLESFSATAGNSGIPTAAVRLKKEDGTLCEDAATGDGPVDAICKAVGKLTGIEATLRDYQLRAVTGGTDAVGEVILHVEYSGRLVIGRGTSTDIIEASARAYLDAINRILSGVPA